MGEYCLLFLPSVLSFPVRVSLLVMEMGEGNQHSSKAMLNF